MFTSKNQLSVQMGVDAEIAAFFVDRKVPADNAYWKDRLLYVSRGTGFLFIPLFFDIQYKLGLPKTEVLDESYVQLAEAILHSAGLLEANAIDTKTHIAQCQALLDGKVKDEVLYQDLNRYFAGQAGLPQSYLGTASKALNRGDSLLYMLCVIPNHALVLNIIAYWYALVPSFLLMDDVMDLHEDKVRGEENAIADFGAGKEGIVKALDYLSQNFALLHTINPLLGTFFQRSLDKKKESVYLQHLLKN